MGKDWGGWVLSTLQGFAQCPEQPAWEPEHSCNGTLIAWPLGNMPLFNAERDMKQGNDGFLVNDVIFPSSYDTYL